MTLSTNFDIIPDGYTRKYRKRKAMKLARKGSPKRRKKRAPKSLEYGPDMYFASMGGME